MRGAQRGQFGLAARGGHARARRRPAPSQAARPRRGGRARQQHVGQARRVPEIAHHDQPGRRARGEQPGPGAGLRGQGQPGRLGGEAVRSLGRARIVLDDHGAAAGDAASHHARALAAAEIFRIGQRGPERRGCRGEKIIHGQQANQRGPRSATRRDPAWQARRNVTDSPGSRRQLRPLSVLSRSPEGAGACSPVRPSKSRDWSSTTVTPSRWTASTCASSGARSSPCSDPTARARPPPSRSWRATGGGTRARSASSATTRPPSAGS